jgi:N-acetylneuraminic acid mutarotase
MKKRRATESTFLNLRRSIRLVVYAAAAGSMVTGALLAFVRPGPPVSQRTLTFAERVAYQRAIEEVYWRHRIWPRNRGERPDPKPRLDAVMSQAQLEKKVEDYLRTSQALEDQWQRPITSEQLQAEMDRMAKDSKQPEVLRELFEALGNDPFVIAECLARPALAERLLANWYAYDQRFHRELKKHAEADLQRHNTIKQMRQTSGSYDEIEFITSDSARDVVDRGVSHGVKLNSLDWEETVQRLAAAFQQSDPVKASAIGVRRDVATEYRTLPVGKLSPLREDETRYYVTAVIEKADNHLKLAIVSWPKEPLESWLAQAAKESPTAITQPSADYTLPTISGGNECLDAWAATAGPPDARLLPTAVWTGAEMIVWGGSNQGGDLNTGGRYNPATDTWTITSSTNAPSARYFHTAVWTGSEMIVWGGGNGSGLYFNTGGRYNPSTDNWTATSTADAPDARTGHTAVWTGNEMIVWGGSFADDTGFHYSDTGGRYNPSTNSWTATSIANAPDGRDSHTAVWTGNEMIVWGGEFSDDAGYHDLNTGGRYNPSTNAWTGTSTINVSVARHANTAVWTGDEMIVWGGYSYELGRLNTGGRYNPTSNAWGATSLTNTPEARYSHSAVWTGTEMIVWGGFATNSLGLNTGARYDPSTDGWTPTTTTEAPLARYYHAAVWTGSEMIIWGGTGVDYSFNTGGRYNPSTNSWTATATFNVPTGRSFHTAVWTGSEMIVWGGFDRLNTGARYTPSTDSWAATAMIDAPDGRYNHTAVWTGLEMIVWGGLSYGNQTHWYNTGGRYNPTTDSWSATSLTNAPDARESHTAVWTGSEMIVWGGDFYDGNYQYLNTGGRYNPEMDSWTPTALTNAPDGRYLHAAVWTGSEMIVWGGYFYDGNDHYLNTGGKYDFVTNTWTATNTANAPAARAGHTAVWTGNEMTVWGGANNSISFRTGGRYDPTTDNWVTTNIPNAVDGRFYHTAVWTGSEMIVWGGSSLSFGALNTGGRYNPDTDSWTLTTTDNAPSARAKHTAIWTGDEMIVWGGDQRCRGRQLEYRREVLRAIWSNADSDSYTYSDTYSNG